MKRRIFSTRILMTSILTLSCQYKIVFADINLSSVACNKEQNVNKKKYKKAHYTFIVYMAADNDLRSFAARNIKQMASIGSNEHIHIVAHLDIRIVGNKKITRRYYIEKNKVLHVNAYDPATQKMDSGQPETLISCCKWAITNYPADEYILVFWNHGTGVLDPVHGRIISPTGLFTYNPTINMLELDRSISILGDNSNAIAGGDYTADILSFLEQNEDATETIDWIKLSDELLQTNDPRGICWDDSAGNYLTNQKLDYALTTIRKNYLDNKKFSIIGFDACLMSMIEVGNLVRNHAHIMVGSQEVELGTGWNYQKVLEPFSFEALNRKNFARHITHVYEETYNRITNDYTQSAIDLDSLGYIEDNVHEVAELLIEALRLQKNNSVHNAIRASKNKLLCTHFDEPSYLDLHHLYTNLEYNLKHFNLTDSLAGKKVIHKLRKALEDGRAIIRKIVLANVSGRNLSQARGLSIYFPERRMHSSYQRVPFAQQNSWFKLLKMYILG